MDKISQIQNSKEWKEFKNYCTSYNIFDQLGFFRLEDIHTNILKSFLIQNNPYELGTFPLKELLKLLISKNPSKIKITIDDLNTYEIQNLNVITQVVLDEKNKPDLLIDFSINNKKCKIILENKFLSYEHDNQCQRYYNYYKSKNDNSINYIFVFLSLEKEPKFKERDKYICINYQELITYIIEPSNDKCKIKSNNIISFDSYLSSFNKLFDYIELSSENNEKFIIPLTKYGKELTHNLEKKHKDFLIDILKNNMEFYKDNKELLKIYYYYLYKNTDDKEIKKLIEKEILKVKCTFNGINYNFKQCCLKIIEYLFNNKIIKNNNDLIKLNNCLLNKNYLIATTDIKNIKHKECYTKNDKLIGKILLNNIELYYYNDGIRYDELKEFVKNVNNEFDNTLKDIVEIY